MWMNSNRREAFKVGTALLLSAAVVVSMPFGCATPTAILVVTAPATAVAGSPFTITVTAMAGRSRDTIFNQDVKFTSSDGAASLPPIYTFTTADAGSHTFTNGVTLMTAGTQSVTAASRYAPSINGSATIMLTSASSGH
jgi:hypothetical protein